MKNKSKKLGWNKWR